MLSSSLRIQSPRVTAACGNWWGWHGPRATGQNGGAPCKILHVLSISARAHLLVVVLWLCGHCIYI